MADPVKLTIDGREIQAAPGTLVIDAAKQNGIGIPAFCYYEGLTLQAACRMCLVEVEKMPKLMTASTLWSFCSPITLSIALSATRAENANCRIWCSATAPVRAATPK